MKNDISEMCNSLIGRGYSLEEALELVKKELETAATKKEEEEKIAAQKKAEAKAKEESLNSIREILAWDMIDWLEESEILKFEEETDADALAKFITAYLKDIEKSVKAKISKETRKTNKNDLFDFFLRDGFLFH